MKRAQSRMFRRLASRSHKYPRADLQPLLKRAIISAILCAWTSILEEDDDGVELDEDDLTALLEDYLNEILNDGNNLFQNVVRDACVTSYNGEELHKRPDLAFRLADQRDPEYAWFAECKVVSREARVSKYLTHGVQRFIDGDYAWAMPSSLMVAYADHGYTPSDKLAKSMKRNKFGKLEDASSLCNEEHELWSSSHERDWCYPDTEKSPGPITLYHLWLNVDEYSAD